MDKLIFKTLNVWCNQSKCQGSHVAAAAVYNNRLLGIGYNGTPKGTLNCNEVFKKETLSPIEFKYYVRLNKELREWSMDGGFVFLYKNPEESFVDCEEYMGSKEKAKDYFNYLHGRWSDKYEVHAEMNLVFNLLKQGCNIPMKDVIIYTNISPCNQCLKNLAGLGVKEIHFEKLYWRSNADELYQAANQLGVTLVYNEKVFEGQISLE